MWVTCPVYLCVRFFLQVASGVQIYQGYYTPLCYFCSVILQLYVLLTYSVLTEGTLSQLEYQVAQ